MPGAAARGLVPQPGVVSYFIGNDPKNWRSGIPTYGKVNYAQIYPGVDLVFYGNQRQLEYDFVVAPGADPSRIAWRIDGARASVDAEGNLALSAPNGPATFKKTGAVPDGWRQEDQRRWVRSPWPGTSTLPAWQLRPFQGADHRSRAQLCQLSWRERHRYHRGDRPDPVSFRSVRRRASRWTARAVRM